MTETVQQERPRPIDTGAKQADIAIANAEAAAKREARKANSAATPAPPAPSPAPTPTPMGSSGNDGGSTAGDNPSQQEDHFPDDVPEWQRRKLEKLVAQRAKRDEKIRQLIAENEQLRRARETGVDSPSPTPTPPAQPSPTPASDAKPTRAQFNGDDEKYLEALSDWKVDQRLKQEAEKAEKARRDQAQKSRWDTFKEREATFAAQHDDFHETAYKSPVNYSQAMVDFITDSEKGPEIAYHLGKHLDEAKAIAALPPMRQAIALDRLEQSLKPVATPDPDDDDENDLAATRTPSPARKVTQAPTPPVTVSPAASAKKSPNDPNAQMTAEERIRMWRQQRRSRRR